MAENEKQAVQAKKDKKSDNKPGFFARVGKWFRDMKSELKKVQWPTWKQTMNNTLIVIAFCVVVGLFIFLFDTLASSLFTALVDLFHG